MENFRNGKEEQEDLKEQTVLRKGKNTVIEMKMSVIFIEQTCVFFLCAMTIVSYNHLRRELVNLKSYEDIIQKTAQIYKEKKIRRKC